MQTFETDFDFSLHCDECSEITRFCFDSECPACHTRRAWTDYYGSPYDCMTEGGEFACSSCGTKFKILKYEYANEPEALIAIAK